MFDRSIPATSTIAANLWVLGAGFIVLDFIFDPPFAAVGLYLTVWAAVFQIRGCLNALRQRERDAYDLGRETVRSLR